MTGERKNSLRDCSQAAFVHIFFMTFPGFQRSVSRAAKPPAHQKNVQDTDSHSM